MLSHFPGYWMFFPVYSWGAPPPYGKSVEDMPVVTLIELIQLCLQLLRDQKHYCTQIPAEYQEKSSKSLVEKSKIIQDSRWTCEVPVSQSGLQLGIYPIHLELIRILAASLRTIANIIKLFCIRAFCCNQQMYIHVMETLPCITSWWQENKTNTCDSFICISKTFTYIYSQKVLLNKDLCLLPMCVCLGGSIMQSIVIPNPCGKVFLAFFPGETHETKPLVVNQHGRGLCKQKHPTRSHLNLHSWTMDFTSGAINQHDMSSPWKTELFRYSSDS